MSRKLLLVDDNHLTVESILYSIKWKELEIESPITAYDGQTALRLMKEELPDLIISDITMPGLTGLELTEQARLLCPSCKIILISAYDKFEYAQNAVRFGVFDYVEKPLDYDYLTQVIQKALKEQNFVKHTPEDSKLHRRLFDYAKDKLIDEWEKNTGTRSNY